MTTRVHLKVSGIVQGVCFRYFCRERADRLGVKGFVRNNDDGSVEAVAEGSEEAVREFLAWCRRGPPSAVVKACEDKYEPPTGEFASFTIGH